VFSTSVGTSPSSDGKPQRHHHYLKGTVYCDHCGARLIFSWNKGNGGTYDYFKCH
jgi:site-specific DNA recombinase